MVDLSSRYMGLELENPLVASSSPLTGRLDTLRRLEDAGVAAVVLPSIFEEQLVHDEAQIGRVAEVGSETFAEAVGGYFPELPDTNSQTEEQLERIRLAKEALSIPVIASLNGHTVGGWTEFATNIEQAGADALELNLYFVPADFSKSGAQLEDEYVALVEQVRAQTQLPLALKLSPFFSSPGHMARRLADAGAQGLVLFNRFLQPDIDLEHMQVRPSASLSTSEELRMPLRWIAILSGRVRASLASTTGVHAPADVVKLLLAGADAVMATSAFLKHGPEHAQVLLDGLQQWLENNEYDSVEQLKGSLNQLNGPDAVAFERANYMAALQRYVWEGGW